MTGSRTRGALLAAVALIAIGYAIYVFSSATPEPVPIRTDNAADMPISSTPTAPTPTPSVAGAPAVIREEQKTDPVALAASPLPASFRAHLAGIAGRVVEEDGTPVPDFAVELFGGGFQDVLFDPYVYFAEDHPTLRLSLGATRTGKDGRFLFRDVDPRGMFALGLDLEGPRAAYRVVDDLPESQEVRDMGDIRLKGFITFRGQVVDLDGAPVPDARVRATDLPPVIFSFGVQNVRGDESLLVSQGPRGKDGRIPAVYQPPRAISDLIRRFPIPTATTDANGEFVLPGVPSGLVTVLVDKKDFITLVHGPNQSGVVGGDRALGQLVLDEGDELHGRVETTEGNPVVGAEILVGPELATDDVAIVWSAGTTDANGRFSAKGLTLDDQVVAAREKDGIDWTVAQHASPGGDEVVIVLPEPLSARITAVSPAGEILMKPDLLLRDFGDDGPGEMPIFQPPRRITARIQYDEDGSAIVNGLRPVRYKVLVRAEGYGAFDLDVDLREDVRSFTATLPIAHSLPVHVLLAADESPVEYAAIAAIAGGRGVVDNIPVSTARTDAAGDATLRGLPEGEYQLRIDHPGYAVQFLNVPIPSDHRVDVPLFMGGAIQGRVHRQGQALDEPRFIAIAPRGNLMVVPKLAVTDLDGNFGFKRLSPGQYEVTVMKRFTEDLNIGELATGMFSFMGGPDFLERETKTEVVEGETTELDIDLFGAGIDGPTATLFGRVMLNGRPAEDSVVTARATQGRGRPKRVRTTAGGLFELGEVGIGDDGLVRLSVTIDAITNSNTSGSFDFNANFYEQYVQLQPNDRREIILDIRAGEVRGRVRDESGRAIAMANVNVRSTNDKSDRDADRVSAVPRTRQNTQTDADGSFRFPMVPARSVQLRVEASGFVDYNHDEPIMVPESGSAQPVQITMTPAIIVSGSVQLPIGATEDSMWMQFEQISADGNGRSSFGTRLNNDLTFSIDDLTAGEFKVTAMIWRQVDDDWETQQFTGSLTVPPQGITGVVIPMVAAPD